MSTTTTPTTPPDPNAPMVVLPALTRNQFWGGLSAVFGTMVVGYIGLIYVLMSVVYGGLNERLKSLEDHFQTAIVADVEIKDLPKNAPHLIQDINEIKEALKPFSQEHDLARVSNHGMIVICRRAPVLAMGKATVLPPPGAFLQATQPRRKFAPMPLAPDTSLIFFPASGPLPSGWRHSQESMPSILKRTRCSLWRKPHLSRDCTRC